MATLGDIVVKLGMNNKQFMAGSRNAQRRMRGMRRDASGLGKAMKGIGSSLATLGAGAAIGKSIKAAQVQIDAEKKLGAVIAATGGAAGISQQQIADYAVQRQKMTNFGDEGTINAAAILATYKNIQGPQFFGAMDAILDMSSVMDQDLKTSVKQVGKALNDPIKGFARLELSGVSFTEEQRVMIRTLQESGDLIGAQAIILGELESEFGGASEAMANGFTQMGNSAGDLAENIGFLLMPVLQDFMDNVNSFADIGGGTSVWKEWGEDLVWLRIQFSHLITEGLISTGAELDRMSAAWDRFAGNISTGELQERLKGIDADEAFEMTQAQNLRNTALGDLRGDGADVPAIPGFAGQPGDDGAAAAAAAAASEQEKIAQRIITSVVTPGEQIIHRLNEARAALNRGDISDDVFGRVLIDAQEQWRKLNEETENHLSLVSSTAGVYSGDAFDRIFALSAFQPGADAPEALPRALQGPADLLENAEKRKAESGDRDVLTEILQELRRGTSATKKITEELEPV